jgi:hypothetical protein
LDDDDDEEENDKDFQDKEWTPRGRGVYVYYSIASRQVTTDIQVAELNASIYSQMRFKNIITIYGK